jgi:hypothetical protein
VINDFVSTEGSLECIVIKTSSSASLRGGVGTAKGFTATLGCVVADGNDARFGVSDFSEVTQPEVVCPMAQFAEAQSNPQTRIPKEYFFIMVISKNY